MEKCQCVCASGAFDSGLAEGVIEEALQPISAIRLVFQSDAVVWAILSEVCPALHAACVFFFHLDWINTNMQSCSFL